MADVERLKEFINENFGASVSGPLAEAISLAMVGQATSPVSISVDEGSATIRFRRPAKRTEQPATVGKLAAMRSVVLAKYDRPTLAQMALQRGQTVDSIVELLAKDYLMEEEGRFRIQCRL